MLELAAAEYSLEERAKMRDHEELSMIEVNQRLSQTSCRIL